jgi:hypothetical protein
MRSSDPGLPIIEAVNAAAKRIRRQRRTLSLGAATEMVMYECRLRGIAFTESWARKQAETLLRPTSWPFLHPVRARREGVRFSWSWRDH